MGIGCLSLSEIFPVKIAFASPFDISHSHELQLGSIDVHHPIYLTNILTCFAEILFGYMWSSFPCSQFALQFSENYMSPWKGQTTYLFGQITGQRWKNTWLALCYIVDGIWLAKGTPGPWSTKQKSAPSTCNKATKSAHCNSICPPFPQQHIISTQRHSNKKYRCQNKQSL